MRSTTNEAIAIPEDTAVLDQRYRELLALCDAQAKLITRLKNRLTHGLYSHYALQVLHSIPFNEPVCTRELHQKFGNTPMQRKKTLRTIRRLKDNQLIINTRPSSQFGYYRRTIDEI